MNLDFELPLTQKYPIQIPLTTTIEDSRENAWRSEGSFVYLRCTIRVNADPIMKNKGYEKK